MGDYTNQVNALRKSARHCESSNDIAGAISNWSQLADLVDDGEAFERLGVLAMRNGEFREAYRYLCKAAMLAPERAKTRVLLARAADEAATPEEALEAWAAAAQSEPGAEAHYRMGVLSNELGREKEAIDHFERSWAADASKIKPVRALARLHELRADYDKASEVWHRISFGENRNESLGHLGRLCSLTGDQEKALSYFEDALAGGDDAQILRKVAAIHEQRGALQKAEDAWRRAIRAKDEAISRDRLGVLLRDQARVDEAIEEFRAAAALEPNIRRYWLQIARACERLGRLEEAEAAWRNIVAFAPDGDAYRRLSILQLKLNRPKEAVKTLEKYVSISGETAESWRKIADALEDADESAAAADAWKRALALDPADEVARRRLLQLYFNEDHYSEVLQSEPASPVIGAGIGEWIGAAFGLRRRTGDSSGPFQEGARDSAIVQAMRRELDDIAACRSPVLVGPWLSEFGFELLYWIPFLKWVLRNHEIAPERVIVASRGGMRPLYAALGESVRYLEIFDFVSPDEFRTLNERRWRDTGLQKHLTISEADELVIRKFNLGADVRLLHPKMMYMLFASFWAGRTGFRRFRSHVELIRMQPVKHSILKSLPASFVAAKFYSRPSFENSPQNAERLRRFVGRLAEKSPVVVMNTGLSPDEHGEFEFEAGHNIYFVNEAISPSENLHAQMAIVSHATHFHCTYGGFAYLPLYFGGSVSSYYSGDRHYLHLHSPAAFWTAEMLGSRMSVIDAAALDA